MMLHNLVRWLTCIYYFFYGNGYVLTIDYSKAAYICFSYIVSLHMCHAHKPNSENMVRKQKQIAYEMTYGV